MSGSSFRCLVPQIGPINFIVEVFAANLPIGEALDRRAVLGRNLAPAFLPLADSGLGDAKCSAQGGLGANDGCGNVNGVVFHGSRS